MRLSSKRLGIPPFTRAMRVQIPLDAPSGWWSNLEIISVGIMLFVLALGLMA